MYKQRSILYVRMYICLSIHMGIEVLKSLIDDIQMRIVKFNQDTVDVIFCKARNSVARLGPIII